MQIGALIFLSHRPILLHTSSPCSVRTSKKMSRVSINPPITSNLMLFIWHHFVSSPFNFSCFGSRVLNCSRKARPVPSAYSTDILHFLLVRRLAGGLRSTPSGSTSYEPAYQYRYVTAKIPTKWYSVPGGGSCYVADSIPFDFRLRQQVAGIFLIYSSCI